MKNVILLVPNLCQGGQERVAVNTAEILSGEYNIRIVLFDAKNQQYSTDCEIVNLNIPTKTGKISKVLNVIKRVKKLTAYKKSFGCDIVYSFGTTANLVNSLSAGPGKRFLSIRGFKSTKLSTLDYKLYKRCDKILCVSKLIKETLDCNYPLLKEKTSVLYNPYNFDKIINSSSEKVDDFIFDKPTIVSSGRLNKIKNFPRLIKAFSLVLKEYDCKLLIIGEGEERNTLEGLIDKYDIGNRACLIGYRDNPFKYLSRSSIYVLSSYKEGFPNSLAEGMIFLPVVSTDCESGPREILSINSNEKASGVEITDYGILVQDADDENFDAEINDDDRSMADAILKLLKDEVFAKEMKEKANMRALEFSFEKYRKQITGIFEEV